MGKTSFVAYKVVRHHIYQSSSSEMDREDRVRPVRNRCSMQRLGNRSGFLGLNIKEKPVKKLLCKILQLVSRLERDVHGEISLVESFERKLAIHSYDWNGLD